eukprot:7335711-Prymnesium_polylepis.2
MSRGGSHDGQQPVALAEADDAAEKRSSNDGRCERNGTDKDRRQSRTDHLADDKARRDTHDGAGDAVGRGARPRRHSFGRDQRAEDRVRRRRRLTQCGGKQAEESKRAHVADGN